MSKIKFYTKTAKQAMEPWREGMDLEGVSVSEYDLKEGSPKKGDMIAYGEGEDAWLVAKNFFEANYKEVRSE